MFKSLTIVVDGEQWDVLETTVSPLDGKTVHVESKQVAANKIVEYLFDIISGEEK